MLITAVAPLPALAEGYQFDATYTADVVSNVSGGLRSGVRHLDNLDLVLEVDVPDTFGIGSGRVFLYGLYNNGTTFADELVGDLQVTSNIDAPDGWRIYEAWYEFGDGPWSLRAGLYDLNSEFDVNEAGALFLNSSHGIGPDFSQTGENGPSIFPVTSLAIRGDWRGGFLSGRLAVLDAGAPYRAFLEQSTVGATARETTWELTYRAIINDHLVIQPDVQYVHHPAATAGLDSAWVVGVRFSATLGWPDTPRP